MAMHANTRTRDRSTTKSVAERFGIVGWTALVVCAGFFLATVSTIAQDASSSKPKAAPKTKSKPKSESKSESNAKTAAKPPSNAARRSSANTSTKAVPIPLELKPYRVRVRVSFGRDPALTSTFRRHVVERIQRVAARTFGQMWKLKVEENRRLLPASVANLQRLTPERLLADWDEDKIDKVFFLTVQSDGSCFRLAGREWESRTRDLSRIQTALTYQRRDLPEVALRLVVRLFRPILAVHSAEPDSAHLRLQAGVFPPADRSAIGIKPGDVIVPFLRYRDKQKVVQRIQFLPMTYLLVKSVQRERIDTKVVSGLRVALGGRSGRRVERMAVAMRPQPGGTRIRLVPRSNPTKPLVGHRVDLFDKRPGAKVEAGTEPVQPIRLMTDRSGSVFVKTRPGQPVVWLDIRSGVSILARVPFVPGLQPHATIPLPDDSIRLALEGEVALLRSDLIDSIAQRAAYVARARALADNDKMQQAAQEIKALEELPGSKQFNTRLTAIRVPAVEKARKQKNRSAESKIKKLCSKLSTQIDQFLNPAFIKDLKDELGVK